MIGLATVYHYSQSNLGVILVVDNRFYSSYGKFFVGDLTPEENCFFLIVEDL